MLQGEILEDNKIIMSIHQATATHAENGEKITVSTAVSGGQPVVRYKGYTVTWDIYDIIGEAVELIENRIGEVEHESNGNASC